MEFLGAAGPPCPAMEFGADRFWCGLVRRPSRYLGTPPVSDRLIGPLVRVELSIGEGCDTGE